MNSRMYILNMYPEQYRGTSALIDASWKERSLAGAASASGASPLSIRKTI